MSAYQGKQKAPGEKVQTKAMVSRTPAAAPRAPVGFYAGGPALRLGQAPVQTKVAVSQPGDPYEREADAVAQRVVAGDKAGPVSSLEEKKEPVQTKDAGGGGAAMQAAAAQAIAAKGPGQPLAPGTRSALESSFGADLGHVRVHDDAASRAAARNLNARAFTHGNDIWMGPGESQNDLRLMAHETTHVFQQGGVVRRSTTAAPAPDPAEVALDEIPMQSWKVPLHTGDLVRRRGYNVSARTNTHVRAWETAAGHINQPRRILRRLIEQAYQAAGREPPQESAWAVEAPGPLVVGPASAESVMQTLSRPQWDRAGRPDDFHVDHRHELQLGGHETSLSNLWLVRGSVNSASGRMIDDMVDMKVREHLRTQNQPTTQADVNRIKSNHALRFGRAVSVRGLGIPNAPDYELRDGDTWTSQQIADGEHLRHVRPLVRGGPGAATSLVVYFGETSRRAVPMNLGAAAGTAQENRLVVPFQIVDKDFSQLQAAQQAPQGGGQQQAQAQIGSLGLRVPDNHRYLRRPGAAQSVARRMAVYRRPGPDLAGFVRHAELLEIRSEYKNLSPMRYRSVEATDRGLHITGQILPELPLLRNRPIDFEINGDDIRFGLTFTAGELTVPPPLQISQASLRLHASSGSFGAEGSINFGLPRLGQGLLRARATREEGLTLTGSFDFDSSLFSRSNVTVEYRAGELSARGTAQIDGGKLRGVRQANLTVSMQRGMFEASGTVEPAIPGVRQGNVTVRYSEAEGFTLTGGIELANIPGIRSGRAELTVRRTDQGYRLAASGTAQPAIPGINSALSISYDNGAFTVSGNVEYRRGMLSGTITAGATNRPLDEQGNPTEGPPQPRMRLFGRGELSLRLAPWLQATAGVRVNARGEVEVTGRIGLPQALDIFPQKAINKNLFTTPPLDIPIVGVAAMGRRIGIFASLSGGLDATAGIGPGQLRELGLQVTYNPSREADTTVVGRAQLFIPAHAGLRLFIRGGLGAGIPLVSAQAGLEVGGQLGLEGALQTNVQVEWSPTRGLRLEAVGEIYAQPKFRFDLTGYVMVTLDLIRSITLYERRWQLAAFEFGSNLRFGIRFPVRYVEGQPFDIRLSDVQFQAPDINVRDMLRGLISRIA